MFDKTVRQGQVEAATMLFEHRDAIEVELYEAAKALKHECEAVLKLDAAQRHRKPPCSLSVRNEPGKFGPKIVWVTFSWSQFQSDDGTKTRFTREVRGRTNGKYPKTTFTVYKSPTREAVIDIEDRAAALRKRIFFWRTTFSEARKIIEQGAN